MRYLLILLYVLITGTTHVNTMSNHIENKCKYYGYWDHLEGPSGGEEFVGFVNMGKSFSASSAQKIIDQDLMTILSISHSLTSDESLEEWRTKLRQHARIIHSYNPSNIVYILLMDEPFLKDFSVEQLEMITDEARKIIGKDYKYGYNFTIGNVRNSILPKNIDIASVNIYPFFEESYHDNGIRNKKDFNRFFSNTVQHLRKKVPDAEYFITGQAFYLPGKWRKPPIESPFWYAEAIKKTPDVLGLLWFEWRDRAKWAGTRSMPDLFENQKEAYKQLCSD